MSTLLVIGLVVAVVVAVVLLYLRRRRVYYLPGSVGAPPDDPSPSPARSAPAPPARYLPEPEPADYAPDPPDHASRRRSMRAMHRRLRRRPERDDPWREAYAEEDELDLEEAILADGEPDASVEDPPRSAYARLEAPDAVTAGREFELVVGLSAVQTPGVVGEELVRPPSSVGAYALTIQVVADGFTLRDDEAWRNDLPVTAAAPSPALTLHLRADAQSAPVLARSIKATYSTGGQTMGFAVRPVAVVRDAALLEDALASAPQPAPHDIALTTEWQPPDLTIRIHRGVAERSGRLLWTFESPHGVSLPEGEPHSDIGLEPERYLKRILEGVPQHENEEDLFAYLKGHGREIADNVPLEAWTLLADVANRVAPGPPSVLLLSEEPYVPWELAVLDPPLDPESPPFLAAQTIMGRWVLGQRRPPPNPPGAAEVEQLAVVWGRYDSATWRRLEGAEREAAALSATYGAASVDATKPPVMRCLRGAPVAQLLHFSMHGQWDQTGLEDGLILTDGKVLDPAVVKGLDLDSHPFVFLNACQVGAGRELLGDYSGMAEAFLYAGACAVVAPLWAIDDQVASEIATRFYERAFTTGESPAEALRRERLAFSDSPGTRTSTSLAYQFFGHPTMRLRRSA